MPQNLEFKARVEGFNLLEKVFVNHGASFVKDLHQVDTYFSVQHGRLKLREIDDERPELIFYQRDETLSSRMHSTYEVVFLDDYQLKGLLTKSLGIRVIVEKERRLLKFRNARIHLDRVKKLGEFLEFEILYEGDEHGDAILLENLKKLAKPFVIEEINESYSDLMMSRRICG
jgi:adenylate cyclase class 2